MRCRARPRPVRRVHHAHRWCTTRRPSRTHLFSIFEEHRMYRRGLPVLFLFAAVSLRAAPLAIDLPGVSIPLDTQATTYAGATLTVSGPNGIIAQHALGP